MRLGEVLSDSTRSALRMLARDADGKVNLYAVTDRRQNMMIVVGARHSEDALNLIQKAGLMEWDLGNTITRSIQRNVAIQPGVWFACEIENNAPRDVRKPKKREA